MKLEYINSSSTVEPETLDTTSSSKVVFVRRHITSREEEQDDGSVVTYYDYEEAKIDKPDWEYLANLVEVENNQEMQDEMLLDIDFRVMMLEEDKTDGE